VTARDRVLAELDKSMKEMMKRYEFLALGDACLALGDEFLALGATLSLKFQFNFVIFSSTQPRKGCRPSALRY
jgi:hypothetical protein